MSRSDDKTDPEGVHVDMTYEENGVNGHSMDPALQAVLIEGLTAKHAATKRVQEQHGQELTELFTSVRLIAQGKTTFQQDLAKSINAVKRRQVPLALLGGVVGAVAVTVAHVVLSHWGVSLR